MSRARPTPGFTLLELLVVMAIAGVLLSVVVPAASRLTGTGGPGAAARDLARLLARTGQRAALTGLPHGVEVDLDQGRVAVKVPLGSEGSYGREVPVPGPEFTLAIPRGVTARWIAAPPRPAGLTSLPRLTFASDLTCEGLALVLHGSGPSVLVRVDAVTGRPSIEPAAGAGGGR